MKNQIVGNCNAVSEGVWTVQLNSRPVQENGFFMTVWFGGLNLFFYNFELIVKSISYVMRNALKSTADPSPHSNSTSVPWSTRTHIVLICCYRWSRASGPVHTWRQRCLFCHFFFLSPGVNSNIGNHATQLKSFTDDIKSLWRRRQVRTALTFHLDPEIKVQRH